MPPWGKPILPNLVVADNPQMTPLPEVLAAPKELRRRPPLLLLLQAPAEAAIRSECLDNASMDAAREDEAPSNPGREAEEGAVPSEDDAVAMRPHVKLHDDEDATEEAPADALYRLQTSLSIAFRPKGL